MSSQGDRRCAQCEFWEPLQNNADRGTCRRMPPTASGTLNVLDLLYHHGGDGAWPEAFSKATLDTQYVLSESAYGELTNALHPVTPANDWCGEYSSNDS